MMLCKTIALQLFIASSCLWGQNSFATDWQSLNQQAIVLTEQENYPQAIELAKQALVVAQNTLPNTAPEMLTSLFYLAQLYQEQAQYDLAEPLLVKRLALIKQQLGQYHPDTVAATDDLMAFYDAQGNDNLLTELNRQLFYAEQFFLGDTNPLTLDTLHEVAQGHGEQGRYELAQALYSKTWHLRARILGENHPDTLSSEMQLAAIYAAKGEYAAAESLLTKILQIREKQLGKTHSDTLTSMDYLAGVYLAQGRYEIAEPLLKKTAQTREKLLGESHPDTLKSKVHLAKLYEKQAHYELAEPLLVKSLSILKKLFGTEHPETLNTMHTLAVGVYQKQGRFALAEPLLQQIVQTLRTQRGERHPLTLIETAYLGYFYQAQAQYQRAEPLLVKTLAQMKTVLDESHPELLLVVNHLAQIYQKQQQFELAEPLLRQSLQLTAATLGQTHPATLLAMNALANLYLVQKQYALAEPLYSEALGLSEKRLGKQHPDTLMHLKNLALLYQTTAQWQKSEPLWQKHLRLSNLFLEQVLWGAGEKTRHAYLQQQTTERDLYLSFYAQQHTTNAATEAFYFSLTRKGQLLRISSEINALSRHTQDSQTQQLIKKFTALKTELANLAISGEDNLEQLEKLTEESNTLEMQLSQKLDSFRAKKRAITPADVRAKLTNKQVLIDFLVYKNQALTTDSEQLMALIVDKKQGVKLINLGAMAAITETVKSYRHIMQTDSLKRDRLLTATSHELYRLIWQPLAAHLVNKKEVYLIPDGILHLLPFKALLDPQNHYLAEQKQLMRLSSARDLLLPNLKSKNNTALIFAAPAFDDSSRTSIWHLPTLKSPQFGKLIGTAQEGYLVRDIIKQKQKVRLFIGDLATEAQVNAVQSPNLLHFATHGFFVENTDQTLQETEPFKRPALNSLALADHPLTRSGLALSGANLGLRGILQQDGTDGVLTALEVLALNLEGTNLVTLSACETGVGDIKIGEGVYSLNRAFQEAGAKAVLSTLWQVADAETILFMRHFYRLLLNHTPAQDALQKTQRYFIEHKNTQDPFYWAAFTVVGKH